MNRRRLALCLAALPLAACVGGGSTALTGDERRALRIGAVEVVTTAAVLENGGVDLRNVLSPDLREALRDEFRDRLAPGGWTMQVEVARLNVVGGTSTALGRGQSRLDATLRLIDPSGTLRATTPITVTAGAAAEGAVGTVAGALTGRRGRFYRALLEDFARESRRLVLGEDLPGQRIVRRARS